MHVAAIVLLAAAGLAYCLGAVLRWRALLRGETRAAAWPLWAGLALHTASVVCSLLDPAGRDFAAGVLGMWAGVASIGFLRRYLAMPSRWLLVLPLGGMALLVAGAGLAERHLGPEPSTMVGGGGWVTRLHVVFMALHLAATAIAAGAGVLYLVAVRQLKSASIGAFTLPNLPRIDTVGERGLVVATALLIGGLATGGVAMGGRGGGGALLQPAIVLALLTMAVLVATLALRLAHRVGRRGIAVASLACLALDALAMISVTVRAHG